MKNLRLLIIYFAVVGLFITSCNPDYLTDMNRNPDRIEEIIPEYAFTAALMAATPSRTNTLVQGMQYLATYKEASASGDKLTGFLSGSFNVYINELNRLMQITNALKDDPDNVNKLAAVEMLRIYHFHITTDQLGDIPYSEAMKGLENRKPKYDTQRSIYLAMLSELDAALTSMDANKPGIFGSADIFFGGDITKWKKFGYTLMMRIGMRMSEVEPALSQQWVEKAAAGGVMKDFEDIAYVQYADVRDQYNPKANAWITGNFMEFGGDNMEGGKLAATFVNHMKNTRDPRIYVLSVVWVPQGTAPETYLPDTSMAAQRGMINGSLSGFPPDFDTYSDPSPIFIYRGSPLVVMEPAEAYFLLAEAALRGWNVGITDAEAYEKAVRAAMGRWKLWPEVSASPNISTIPEAAINAYLANNLYGGSYEQKFEQIMTQRWVSMWDNEYEVWANWRRVKLPIFNYANWLNTDGTYTHFPGSVSGGKMFRRCSLPTTEQLLNPDNYYEALERQGFSDENRDMLQGRMWWDLESVGNGSGQSNAN